MQHGSARTRRTSSSRKARDMQPPRDVQEAAYDNDERLFAPTASRTSSKSPSAGASPQARPAAAPAASGRPVDGGAPLLEPDARRAAFQKQKQPSFISMSPLTSPAGSPRDGQGAGGASSRGNGKEAARSVDEAVPTVVAATAAAAAAAAAAAEFKGGAGGDANEALAAGAVELLERMDALSDMASQHSTQSSSTGGRGPKLLDYSQLSRGDLEYLLQAKALQVSRLRKDLSLMSANAANVAALEARAQEMEKRAAELEAELRKVLEERESQEERLALLEFEKLELEMKFDDRLEQKRAELEASMQARLQETQRLLEASQNAVGDAVARLEREYEARVAQLQRQQGAGVLDQRREIVQKIEMLEQKLRQSVEAHQLEKGIMEKRLALAKEELAEARQALERQEEALQKRAADMAERLESERESSRRRAEAAAAAAAASATAAAAAVAAEKSPAREEKVATATREQQHQLHQLQRRLRQIETERSEMEERLEAVLAHNARLERKLQEAEANATADDIRARLQRAKRENANLQAAMVKLQRDFDQLDTEWEAKLAAMRAEYDEKLREQQTLIFHAEQTKLTYAEEQNAGLRKRVEEAEASAAAAQKEAAQAMSSLSERDLQLARETRRHEEWAQSMSLRAQALEKESNELRFRLQTAQADREYHSRAQEVERMNEAALIAADVEGSNTTAREEAEYEALVRNLRLQVSRLETRLADSEAHLAAERKLHSEFAASMEKKAKERDRQDELLRQSLEEKNQALMRRVQESEKQLHAVMEQARREREQHIINLKKLESDFKSNTLRGAPRRLREDGTGPGEPATVVKEFTGGVRDDDELPLAKGDKVLVLKKSGGWWRGRKVKEGWFPSSYVKLTTQDQNQFTLLQLRAVLAETEAVAPINGIVFCSVDKWPT